MRLINTETLEMEEHVGWRDMSYAVLSHRWGKDEPTFQSFTDGSCTRYGGWSKVEMFCKKAKDFHIPYAWCDTVCIDKTSSAELNEAVNSMYELYQLAAVCIVYLQDVSEDERLKFESSDWFERGWTLQELLAPLDVRFYDRKWGALGDRNSLEDQISRASGIAVEYLQSTDGASIAQRMSWAAKRKTTRPEDIAYCLLGLFDVNMPLIYGEGGQKAFLRLQEEIIRQSDDESIFAWGLSRSLKPAKSGMLAALPSDFDGCGDIVSESFYERSPYHMTNKGLVIKTSRREFHPMGTQGSRISEAALNCRFRSSRSSLVIDLIGKFGESHVFCRIGPFREGSATYQSVVTEAEEIYIPQKDHRQRPWSDYFGWHELWIPYECRTLATSDPSKALATTDRDLDQLPRSPVDSLSEVLAGPSFVEYVQLYHPQTPNSRSISLEYQSHLGLVAHDKISGLKWVALRNTQDEDFWKQRGWDLTLPKFLSIEPVPTQSKKS